MVVSGEKPVKQGVHQASLMTTGQVLSNILTISLPLCLPLLNWQKSLLVGEIAPFDKAFKEYISKVPCHSMWAEDIAVHALFGNRSKALAEKLEDVMEKTEDLVLKEQRYLAQSKFSNKEYEGFRHDDCLYIFTPPKGYDVNSQQNLHQWILMEHILYVFDEIFVTDPELVQQEEDILKANLKVIFLSRTKVHNTKGNDLYLSGVFEDFKVPAESAPSDMNDQLESNLLLPHDDDAKLPEDKGNKSDKGNMDKNGNRNADNKDANSKNNGDLKPFSKRRKELQDEDLRPFLYHFKTGFDTLCASSGHLVVLTILYGCNKEVFLDHEEGGTVAMDQMWAMDALDYVHYKLFLDHDKGNTYAINRIWRLGIILLYLLCRYPTLNRKADFHCDDIIDIGPKANSQQQSKLEQDGHVFPAMEWCNLTQSVRKHIKGCIHFIQTPLSGNNLQTGVGGDAFMNQSKKQSKKKKRWKLKELKNKEKNEEQDKNKRNIQHWLCLYHERWNSPEDLEKYNSIPVPCGTWECMKWQ
eukprot:jgi/Psemu1/1026/gm1.1026_g